ncbi:MAG: SusC/RagA family TonB-linked outer membrane protein [Reichenbachiella sp.]
MKRILLICFMLLSALVTESWAQDRTVSGTVKDDSGEAIPGVNVILKGTTTGTTSDLDGNWSFSVPSEGGTLVFTFVGMETQEVEIGSRSVIDVSMSSDATELSEVVVTAFGIERDKKALSYSVGSVEAEQIQQISEPDVLKSMQGKIPGVNISGSSGAPGSASRITIRGASSFFGNNDPLFIVDGVPYNNTQRNTSNQLLGGGAYGSPLSFLDPNTIADVKVLKGAAASALYGSRAANGVILITTKGGTVNASKKGLEVTVATSYAQERIANLPDYQNKYGNGSEFNYQNANGSWGPAFAARDSFPTWPTFTAAFPELPTNSPYNAEPNNVSDLFQVGHVFETSLSVIGGNEKSTFSGSVSHVDQTGYIPHSGFKRTSANFGSRTQLDNKFNFGFNATYSLAETEGPFFGENGAASPETASSFARTLWLGRHWDSDLPYETPTGGNVFYNGNGIDNPRWSWKHNGVEERTDRIGASMDVGYDILEWLNFTVRGGINQYTTTRRQNYDIGSNAYSGVGAMSMDVIQFEERNLDILLKGTRDLSDDLNIVAILGYNANQRTTDWNSVLGTAMIAPDIFDLDNMGSVVPNGGNYSQRRLLGAFYDISLGYKDYLFFNTTGRNDWSSTLPVENRSFFYPSASLSFVFTEALGINSNVLSFGKVRASWAKVGNDASPYQLVNTFSPNLGQAAGVIGSQPDIDFPLFGQSALTQSNGAGDPNLTPEFTTELEFGTNLNFFGGRIDLDVTYYKRNTTDLIGTISIPHVTGFEVLTTNFGEIENKGWEIGLNLVPVKLDNGLTWEMFINYTKNTNTVVSLSDGVETINQRNLFAGGVRPVFEPGQPYGSLKGSTSARDDEGNYLVNPATGLLFPAVGDDLDQIIGNPNPNFTIDLSNTISWKGLRLGFLISYRDGGDIYTTTVERLLGRGVTTDTENRELSRIIPGFLGDPQTGMPILDDAGNKIPNTVQVTTNDLFFAAGGPQSFAINGADEMSVFDGTVIRLREISLGYSLPTSLLSKTPFGSATISVSGRNLWYFAPNIPHGTNFDPEVNGFGSTNTQGIEYAAAPQAKRIGVNLKFTF